MIFSAAFFFSALQMTGQPAVDDLEQLKKLNAQFIHNFVTNDVAAHDRILHPGFVHISSSGKVTARKEYLEDWKHGFDGFLYWDYRNEQISIFGNTALVRSQNSYVYAKDGQQINGISMYTDTYVRENGEWKCIQAQILKPEPAFFGGDETIVRKYDFRK